jgi:hypothetical protein
MDNNNGKELGFYHPDKGYWQTISKPSARQLAAYPKGTVQVPVQPSENKRWNGTGWVDDPNYKKEQRTSVILPLAVVLGNMVEAGWLPESAAEAWLDRTSLPGPLTAEIASLPNPKTRLVARAALFAPSIWRLDPVWVKVFQRFNKTDAEVDAVFGIV